MSIEKLWKKYLQAEVPVTPGARLFLVLLHLLGIRKRGYIEMTRSDLGKRLRVHPHTIAKWEGEWQRLKILQVLPGQIVRECCGERQNTSNCSRCGKPGLVVERKPHRLVWLAQEDPAA